MGIFAFSTTTCFASIAISTFSIFSANCVKYSMASLTSLSKSMDLAHLEGLIRAAAICGRGNFQTVFLYPHIFLVSHRNLLLCHTSLGFVTGCAAHFLFYEYVGASGLQLTAVPRSCFLVPSFLSNLYSFTEFY